MSTKDNIRKMREKEAKRIASLKTPESGVRPAKSSKSIPNIIMHNIQRLNYHQGAYYLPSNKPIKDCAFSYSPKKNKK